MIVFYGKWKVGTSFKDLCDYLGKSCILMDDTDRDDTVLASTDVIVPTPWISQQHDVYTKYWNKVTAELDMCQCIMHEQGLHPLTIGITWTDGKSTVTWLIAESLRQLLPTYHVHITWNFDDAMSKTILDILQAWTKNEQHIFVAECSSFMLYPIKQYHFDIGIWTNFATDHLNWHPTMTEYFNAKQQMFVHADVCYTSQEVYSQLSPAIQPKTHIYPISYDLSTTHFVGKHNERNCALTQEVIKKFLEKIAIDTVNDSTITAAIWTIKPLKHRMQPIKTINWITRYDDGKSTSAQSLWAALSSFDKPIITICGGSDKWDSFDHLAPLFKHNTVHAILLGQTSPLFAKVFDAVWIPYTITTSMNECVQKAREKAQEYKTDTILFSPWCASFDLFKNYEDRANQYIAAIDAIQ